MHAIKRCLCFGSGSGSGAGSGALGRRMLRPTCACPSSCHARPSLPPLHPHFSAVFGDADDSQLFRFNQTDSGAYTIEGKTGAGCLESVVIPYGGGFSFQLKVIACAHMCACARMCCSSSPSAKVELPRAVSGACCPCAAGCCMRVAMTMVLPGVLPVHSGRSAFQTLRQVIQAV